VVPRTLLRQSRRSAQFRDELSAAVSKVRHISVGAQILGVEFSALFRAFIEVLSSCLRPPACMLQVLSTAPARKFIQDYQCSTNVRTRPARIGFVTWIWAPCYSPWRLRREAGWSLSRFPQLSEKWLQILAL